MKIIQITDLHIGRKDEDTFDIDVRKNFMDILKVIKKLGPDLLVLSGDLCYRESEPDIYRWIKSHLDFLQLPYEVMAGNHDDSQIMAEVFNRKHLLIDDELYFKKIIGNYGILFLDSSKGFLSEKQLKWLEHEMHLIKKEVLIFMHHPPVDGGVPHMESNYAMKGREVLQFILAKYPKNIPIFCGHYHVEKTIFVENLLVHITPSCFFQIDWRERDFKVDHHRIALREIELGKGYLRSTVSYFEGNKLR